MLARGTAPSSPFAIMCSDRKAAPAEVPATGTPAALSVRIVRATSVPPSVVARRSWLPPVRKMPVAFTSFSSSSGRSQSARDSKGSARTRPAPSSVNSDS